jgi:hypothetical protein
MNASYSSLDNTSDCDGTGQYSFVDQPSQNLGGNMKPSSADFLSQEDADDAIKCGVRGLRVNDNITMIEMHVSREMFFNYY